MSSDRDGPSRAEIRAASKKSALVVAGWNKDNTVLVESKQDVVVLLEEVLSSTGHAGHFGATVPALRILCTLIPGAPEPGVAGSLNKIPLVEAMLVAAKAMGGVTSARPLTPADATSETISASDWKIMKAALAKSRREHTSRIELFSDSSEFSSSSEDSDQGVSLKAIAVKKAGELSFLYRYRTKGTGDLSKAEVFEGVSKDLADELVFANGIEGMSGKQVRARYESIARFLPSMVKRRSLPASVLSAPSVFYVDALESFLAKHKGWKASKTVQSRASSSRTVAKRQASKRSRQQISTDSDEPAKKAPAVVAFAREAKPAEAIRLKDIEKGVSLANVFKVWRKGTDKILPYQALKFIGKEVASPLSDFMHPTRGVYNTLVSGAQTELRDTKLRNIFEDIVYKLVPGREERRNEYEAAEALRDKGGALAKAARKRRAKSESVLLSRLALECELCMMGAKSWSEFEGTLRGDGVAEAIRISLLNSSGSDSDVGMVSLKTAAAAWNRAMAAKVTPPRAKQFHGRDKRNQRQRQPKSEAQLLVASMQSGFASLRNSLANGGWASNGNNGGGRSGVQGANQRSKSGSGGKGGRDCWQCGKPGHTWWQKSRCPLAGKDPAPGSKHAERNAGAAAAAAGEGP